MLKLRNRPIRATSGTIYTAEDLAAGRLPDDDFGSPVERAVAEFAPLPTLTPEALKQRASALYAKSNALLAVEKTSRQHLYDQARALEQEAEIVEYAEKHGLPRLSTEPLRWRMPNGTPRLVPIPINMDGFTISVHRDWSGHRSYRTNPSGGIYSYYTDVFSALTNSLPKKNGASFQRDYVVSYDGVIPDETRERIRSHQFVEPRDEVYLVTEQENVKWEVGSLKEIPRPRVDPLVVVYRYDSLWLIDKFDTVPLEEYVLAEFTETR